MQYFAQDEATRLDPALTVYETLASGSPMHMVPAIRNILGGFLFSGDDVYKQVRVLSGGERTRLAVARMLLRPSNTLLLDEPTNHLDLDSKDVLLDALADYGGTLVFVSHDRYFVERLATKIVEVGDGEAVVYPGHLRRVPVAASERAEQARGAAAAPTPRPAGARVRRPEPRRRARRGGRPRPGRSRRCRRATGRRGRRTRRRKRERAGRRRREQDAGRRQARIAGLEDRIAEREQAIKQIEAAMAAPGFYDDRTAAQPVIDRHQALMWEVGDLMHQWEELQSGPPEVTETGS